MSDNNKVVLIVDALNLFTRHFIAHPAIGANGEHVGGIVGFLYAIVNFSEKYKPDNVVVVWEGGGSTKKRSIYPEYKMHRRPAKLNRAYDKDMPDTVQNRNHQISVLVEVMNNLPILQMYVPDCEADDIIGYLCKYKLKDDKKVIVSSDKDFYQLLNLNTIIYSPTWKKLVTQKEVSEKFSILPENFCLAKSICGDASDNIHGVPRAGFKSLSKRFPQLKMKNDVTIDEMIETSRLAISEGSKIKLFQNILDSEDIIRRNWKLIHLDTNNLSANQINQAIDLVDTFEIKRDKLSVMRVLIREGIQTFNVDRMFLSLNHVGA